jgi:hypothetical protein
MEIQGNKSDKKLQDKSIIPHEICLKKAPHSLLLSLLKGSHRTIEMRWTLAYAFAFAQLASASSVESRDTVTAQVNFNQNTGWPQHLASGLLYGVPDTVNQIPVGFSPLCSVTVSFHSDQVSRYNFLRILGIIMNEQEAHRSQPLAAAGSSA